MRLQRKSLIRDLEAIKLSQKMKKMLKIPHRFSTHNDSRPLGASARDESEGGVEWRRKIVNANCLIFEIIFAELKIIKIKPFIVANLIEF